MTNTFYKNKKKYYFVAILLSAISIFAASLYIPLSDAIYGVPFVAKINPEIKDNGFFVVIDLPCNNIYTREVGFILDPPINVASIADAQLAVTGKVKLLVEQTDGKIEKVIDLSRSGWSVGSAGLTSKIILRYPPIGSFFCRKQHIVAEASDLNIDLKKHIVTIYVSRDRRP